MPGKVSYPHQVHPHTRSTSELRTHDAIVLAMQRRAASERQGLTGSCAMSVGTCPTSFYSTPPLPRWNQGTRYGIDNSRSASGRRRTASRILPPMTPSEAAVPLRCIDVPVFSNKHRSLFGLRYWRVLIGLCLANILFVQENRFPCTALSLRESSDDMARLPSAKFMCPSLARRYPNMSLLSSSACRPATLPLSI
ncbi:hypothetical protein OE88DRAFT_60226 [Heliocybe sulcata]|uniref:Uncharacterized protein n=1 Tax=Heliocybe sulcata TaxID=5364 RepID=A0A5C3NHG9_9AGAM|nr:hypothetical protein OE88DRAFT_60226 [Heliocybe sulcata]